MVITGTFSAGKSGNIAGTVNGDVFVKGKLTILKEAVIRGDITAVEVVVYGSIDGDVKCSGKMTVQSGARIKGNISTNEIHIEKNASVEGLITKTTEAYTLKEEASNNVEEPASGNDGLPNPRPSKRNEDVSPETWF